MAKVCYALQCIKEIKGSANYTEDGPTMIVGSGGDMFGTMHSEKHEIVCDNIDYYINSLKLEFARFRLTEHNVNTCKRKYVMMFKFPASTTAKELYDLLLHSELPNINDQLASVVSDLQTLEYNMCLLVEQLTNSNQRYAITIPNAPFVLTHTDDPAQIHAMISSLRSYVSQLSMSGTYNIRCGDMRSTNLTNTPIDTSNDTSAIHRPVLGDELVLTDVTYKNITADEMIQIMESTIAIVSKVCDQLRIRERELCALSSELSQIHTAICDMISQLATHIL